MSNALKDRLNDAKTALETIKSSMKKPETDQPQIKEIIDYLDHFNSWNILIDKRVLAFNMLTELRPPPKEMLPLPGIATLQSPPVKDFEAERLFRVQAYFATTWSISDLISAFCGKILCTLNKANRSTHPAKLPDFIKNDSKEISAFLCMMLRANFGYAIALSYKLRNRFIHEAGLIKEKELFGDDFDIPKDNWSTIIKSVTDDQSFGSKIQSKIRDGVKIPEDMVSDLRVVLNLLQNETDEVLGILVGTAIGTFESLVKYTLCED